MKKPFLHVHQTEDGWQAMAAFQVFHRQPEEWLRMRWGFNAGALLDEALDRCKLFVESQSLSETEFRSFVPPTRTLALRGINLPGIGLQMGLLGKASGQDREDAQQNALTYARELYSTFPHDFILVPAETSDEYKRLSGENLLCTQSGVAQIQRGLVSIPGMDDHSPVCGLWQASHRSNEQIWRALSNMPQQAMFNIQLQPTFFYEGEKRSLLELKNQISETNQNSESTSAYGAWLQTIIKRRLALWRRFFLLQVHVVVEGVVDENLLRSIGSSLVRDTNELSLPGFQFNLPDSEGTGREWCEAILSMDFIPSPRMEDLADSDEAFAVFRCPYFLEPGLPGAKFMMHQGKTSPQPNDQG